MIKYNLIKLVIDNSVADNWEDAVEEWDITDEDEDENMESQCVCGKENIKYLFEITNRLNFKKLYPVGSSCIRKFERDDLNEEVNIYEQLFKLSHAIRDGADITLSTEFFSRKLLEWLYEQDAFLPNRYNEYDGYNDYEFMVKMFNKRTDASSKQDYKIQKVIEGSIIPFVINRTK